MSDTRERDIHTWGNWGQGPSFWRRVAKADQRLLLLDYDGTLAPFTPERDRAFPYSEVPGVLRALQQAGRTRVVLVSGRESSVVARLLGLDPPPEIWGCHGGEHLAPDGTLTPVSLSDTQRDGLRQAAALADEAGAGTNLEYKPGCVALHWRGAQGAGLRTTANMLHENWQKLSQTFALALHPFDGGLELRAAHLSKAHAVKTLVAEVPAATSAAAYLGDDRTDEDGFAALGERGLSVLVRKQWRPTLASLWLVPPEELLQFLRRWLQAARHGDDETI